MTMDLLFTAGAFVVALGILIAVHEAGHFWVARGLGVRVLRFSIGFGRPLWSRQRDPDSTEYVLAAIPLGGYVKMLDEREEEVPPHLAHLAFNRQALWKRTAIVAAGPAFNLLFAILVYWALFMGGETGLKPVVGAVTPETPAAQAGFREGDLLLAIGGRESPSWETAVFAFMAEAMQGEDLVVRVRDAAGAERERLIPAERIADLPEDPNALERLGLAPDRPRLPAVIGELVPGEAAEAAGLRLGDRILSVNGEPVADWKQWVDTVRKRPGEPLDLEIERAGAQLALQVTPRTIDQDGTAIGRIGAGVAPQDDLFAPYRVVVRYGPLESMEQAVGKTADIVQLMLGVIGRMLVGQASVENLSGPITIAEAAGRTASYGLDSFVKFLAMVSISLGVLNLLPVPILDGGHLLYFFIEWVKGSPLSEQAQAHGQRVGIVLIAALMSLAFYVDLSRLFG